MAYELTKKALEQLSDTVPIDEAAVPSATTRQEPVGADTMTELLLETFFSVDESKQLQRNGENDTLEYVDRKQPNAKRTIDAKYDKETGILTILKADGSVIEIPNLPTVKSLGKGPTGKKGKRGTPGKDGRDGKDGPQGYVGDPGPIGRAGSIGVSGADGNPGKSGPVGPTGPQGPQGEDGPQGPQGRKGYTGARGLAGCTGADGPQGPQGSAPNTSVYISTSPPGSAVYLWGFPV